MLCNPFRSGSAHSTGSHLNFRSVFQLSNRPLVGGLKLLPKEDKALILLARAEAFAGSLPTAHKQATLSTTAILSAAPARADFASDVHSFTSGAFVHGGVIVISYKEFDKDVPKVDCSICTASSFA